MVVSKTRDHIHIKIKIPNPSQEPPASSKAQNEVLKYMDNLCTFKTKTDPKSQDKIWNMGESKTSDHIQINIRMQHSSQEAPVSFKAPKQDL